MRRKNDRSPALVHGRLRRNRHVAIAPVRLAASVHASPASAKDVATVLLEYLRRHLDTADLQFGSGPLELHDGWEAHTYRFQLNASASLPTEFAEPLILRIYTSPHGVPRARHEFAVQQFLGRAQYPVARPLLLEPDCSFFGGPFLLMRRLEGQPLLQVLQRRPWRLPTAPAAMARMQHTLHSLSSTGFPTTGEPVLDRRLKEMDRVIQEYELPALQPGLAWLLKNRPRQSEKPSILHLDFHPINLLEGADRRLTVVDWTEADVGDRHADVATSLMLMQCVAPRQRSIYGHLSILIGRIMMARWYLQAYDRLHPLDMQRLAYYRAWAALRQLCWCGRWMRAGPVITGSKPSVLQYLRPHHVHRLESYFHRWSGATVRLLPEDASSPYGRSRLAETGI